MNKRWFGLGLSSLLVAGCLFGGSGSHEVAAQDATPTPLPLGKQVAVVEAEKLLQQHPDYPKLQELDNQVRQLESEIQVLPLKDMESNRKVIQDKFTKALQDAKAEMEGERSRIEAEMEGLSRALQGQMSAELQDTKVKLDRDLQEKLRKLRAQAPQSADTPADNMTGNMKEYIENLKLVASRNVTARRLELEKASQNEIAAERSRLDQEMAAYEDQIASRYQEEKLNLQLKMQNSPSEEVEKATRERLNQIDDEAAAAKQEKRKAADAQLEQFRAKKEAEFKSQVAAYEAQVKDEMQAKVAKLAGVPAPVAAPKISGPEKAEMEKAIAAAQAEMQSQLASKKAQLEATMASKAAEAKQRLQAKATEVKARLEQIEIQLKEEMAKRRQYLSKATQAKIAQAEKSLEKAKADRKQVSDKMLADLSKVVGKVADKQNIPCVIGLVGEYTYADSSVQDLTDLSMVEVKQIGSR